MQISVDLPESLLITVTDDANRLNCSPQTILAQYLAAGMQIQLGGRAVVLQGKALESLEHRFGHGQISSAADLVAKIEKLARIEFGSHEITLTPAELEELTWRAHKQGKTIGQLVEATWQNMNQLFFSYAQRS